MDPIPESILRRRTGRKSDSEGVSFAVNDSKADEKEVVWGKTPSGEVFKVPTTHHSLTLFDPTYPKSHFDLLSLALLGLQFVIFFTLPISLSRPFFFVYFVFWRFMYNAGLGWILTRQSKHKYIVREVQKRGWLDPERRPKVREWIRQQLSGKMGSDYSFDDLPQEYNTWLLFRQVVDIILLNDFLSYCLFGLSCFRVPTNLSPVLHIIRWIAGLALIAFNWWVKTEAHHVVKDYGWYWGDCFFQRGALVFDGVFEMAPHPMYSVGYAGFYGLSLIIGSYSVLFVSLAAHAAQFAFLVFFENPHIDRLYGQQKPLAVRTPPLRPRSVSATSVLSNEISEATAIDADSVVSGDVTPMTPAESRTPTVSRHDMLNRYFRKDALIFSNIDLLRTTDFQLVLLITYAFGSAFITPNLSPKAAMAIHFTHALLWRLFHSFGLGLSLKAQSENKFIVRHFIKNYHYPPNDEGAAVAEAFANWKSVYNTSLVMTYVSFIAFTVMNYSIPTEWTVGDQLLRHTLGALLIALHVWAASESYEVLGTFGWFFGDFFIEAFPASLTYTGIYRFLNNPERTMSGAALFGLALISGSKSVFALALISHLAHWWFLSYVEGPHMKRLYGDSLRKDAGLTKVLKNVAIKNAKRFETEAVKRVPELEKLTQEVTKAVDKVYGKTAVVVEEFIAKSKPKVSEFVSDTHKALQRSRERLVFTPMASDLTNYDQSKYHMTVITTNPDGQMRFHWGEPIVLAWRSPAHHSRRDWVGLYRFGANKSKLMTKTSSFGLWVPVHDEEWDGDLPVPLTDRQEGKDDCGELIFKKETLAWYTGEYELRYHHDGKYNVVAYLGPIQVYLDRPDELDFISIRRWLLKIVILALDSDPSLIPASASLSPDTPLINESDDDFRFWSERQAKRIAYAIEQVLAVEFAPEVIVADANVSTITRRILSSKQLLSP